MKRKWMGLLLVIAMLVCACGNTERIGTDAHKALQTLKTIEVDLTNEQYGIGVNKKNKELLDQVNAFIAESQRNGRFDEIESHYMGDGEPVMVTSAERDETRDQLVVSSTLDFEPFEYGDIGEYYGIDMEIASALARYLDRELVIISSSFETMFMAVKQQKSDICIGGISITEERKELVAFSDPYYITSQCLVVPQDNTEFDEARTAEDVERILRSKDKSSVIGVENLTTAQSYCEGSRKEGYAGFPLTVRGYRDVETALVALRDQECQYVMGDYATVQWFVDKVNGESR